MNTILLLPNLWISDKHTANNLEFFKTNNIRAVINLTSDTPNYINYVNYLNIKLDINDDRILNNLNKIFKETNDFIYNCYKNNISILIHSNDNNHLSQLIAGIFMVAYLSLSAHDVFSYLKSIKKNKIPITVLEKYKIYFDVYSSIKHAQ